MLALANPNQRILEQEWSQKLSSEASSRQKSEVNCIVAYLEESQIGEILEMYHCGILPDQGFKKDMPQPLYMWLLYCHKYGHKIFYNPSFPPFEFPTLCGGVDTYEGTNGLYEIGNILTHGYHNLVQSWRRQKDLYDHPMVYTFHKGALYLQPSVNYRVKKPSFFLRSVPEDWKEPEEYFMDDLPPVENI